MYGLSPKTVFESEFLTSAEGSRRLYRQLMSEAARIVCDCLPNQPYAGKNAAALASLIDGNFLPQKEYSYEQLVEKLRIIVANSVALGHPNTIAHLHCPPLLAALAAEVVDQCS